MSLSDKVRIHSDRALAELDLACTAANAAVARAHFDLTALHLEAMRNLVAPPAQRSTPSR